VFLYFTNSKIHFVGQGLAPAENSALKIRGLKIEKRKGKTDENGKCNI